VLDTRVRELGLPNVSMLPLQEGEDYRALLADVDVCFITQQAGRGTRSFRANFWGCSRRVSRSSSSPMRRVSSRGQSAKGNTDSAWRRDSQRNWHALWTRSLRIRSVSPAYSTAGQQYVQQWEKTAVMENFERELVRLATESL
jgi:hypothetical protein